MKLRLLKRFETAQQSLWFANRVKLSAIGMVLVILLARYNAKGVKT